MKSIDALCRVSDSAHASCPGYRGKKEQVGRFVESLASPAGS